MTTEMSGTPDSCIPLIFYALRTPKRRAACIAELQEIDAKMTAHEQAAAVPVPVIHHGV